MIKIFQATVPLVFAVLAGSPVYSASLTSPELPRQVERTADEVQKIHWRRHRHCHWRHGERRCHGRYARYRPYHYGRPGIYLRFGTDRHYYRDRRYRR